MPDSRIAGRPERLSVVAISHGPTPYYTPILNALSERVRLHVIYLGNGTMQGTGGSSWDAFADAWGEPPRFELSTYRSVPIRLGRLDFNARFSVGIGRRLDRLRPDVILAHSWGPLMIEPLLWARATGRRSVMWTESGATTGLLRDPVTMATRRRIVGLADAVVSSGSEATKFIQQLGADPSKIVTSCLPSSLAHSIAERVAGPTVGASHPERRFLFVGRLVDLKRPLNLARAFLRAQPRLGNATLTFAGEGPVRPSLDALAAKSGGRIRLIGRSEGIDLADRFLAADVLVVPSVREVWGLVVNEGLAAGLFIVATDQVASAVDLVADGVGLIVPADDVDLLAESLVQAASADHSEQARERRRASVSHCTPDAFATAIDHAIDRAFGVAPRRAPIL